MSFCIPKHLVDAFLQDIKSGKVTPDKLNKMTSEQRRGFFEKQFGKFNAPKVNALFESKLLLKNQQRGMVTWAEKITGMKPEAKRDLVSRIQRMDKILEPKTEDAFLADLARQRLGTSVTVKEAGNIAALARDVKVSEAKIDMSSPAGSKSRMEYGRPRVALQDYVDGLKDAAKAKTLFDYAHPSGWGPGVADTFGFLKSMKATFDNSAIGRQGLKTLFTYPKIWLKNSAQTFVDAFKVLKGRDVMKEVRADIISRDNALSGLYKRRKI